MIKTTLATLMGLGLSCSAIAEGYYHKGEFVELFNKQTLTETSLQYTTKAGLEKRLTNKIILKTINHYEPEYFEQAYPLTLVKQYGQTFVFEVEEIESTLDISQRIYEGEAVVFAHPSFIKTIKPNKLNFKNLAGPSKSLTPKIISHSNEDTKSMLDVEESVNYWKYYDDIFRYKDESFWHVHNKGGFVTQAFSNGAFYDVISQEDVDTNVLQVIDQGITGKGVKVLVVDSSFELTHPDLRFSDSYNFNLRNKDVTPNSSADFHGTSVAGVIGANKGNNYGVMGVAPDAYMIAFNGLFDIEEDQLFSQGYLDIFYTALDQDVDIINCSWSTLEALDEASEDAINTFITEARDGKGGFVVFSSGNESSTSLSNEAALDKVISVGSIEPDGSRSLYSNFGKKLDLVAPSNFVSLDLQGQSGFEDSEMGFVAGTSFSAPIVSGILALILEANPQLTNEDLLHILFSTTKKLGEGSYSGNNLSYDYHHDIEPNSPFNALYSKSVHVGYGLIDAEAAVSKAILYKAEAARDSVEKPPQTFLSDLKNGWNYVGTVDEINNFRVFNNITIVWSLTSRGWEGYSPNLEYAKELRAQGKLLSKISEGSSLWVYNDED